MLVEQDNTQNSKTVTLSLLDEIRAGLSKTPKQINPKFFYDERGSRLFDQITQLPEYYPTRTELSLLERYATDIAEITGQGAVLLEPGAGSCEKVRYLLPEMLPACYVPIDISGDYLFAAAKSLQQDFTDITVFPVADDMKSDIQIPTEFEGLRKLVFYPGSTIGNYTPEQAVGFLHHVHSLVGVSGGLLIGVDLEKDKDILDRAYNDDAGITAAFNLNCLSHINTLTGSNFEIDKFRHVAFYNAQESRIEMHLESACDQSVNLVGEVISFKDSERILTEYSYKYSIPRFTELAASAGLEARAQWVDDDSLFSLQYFTAR
ncbi:MAG: L-histidine N(alpha)-methyltransferase [Halioglobus sp.]